MMKKINKDVIELSGPNIVYSAMAIVKWLRLEREFKRPYDCPVSWFKWVAAVKEVISRSYEVDDGLWKEAYSKGIEKAKECFGKKMAFRTFVKELGVTGVGQTMTEEERGDLIVNLLMLLHIIRDNEDESLLGKYKTDIMDICTSQLDGGNILKQSEEIAENIILQSSQFLADVEAQILKDATGKANQK